MTIMVISSEGFVCDTFPHTAQGLLAADRERAACSTRAAKASGYLAPQYRVDVDGVQVELLRPFTHGAAALTLRAAALGQAGFDLFSDEVADMDLLEAERAMDRKAA